MSPGFSMAQILTTLHDQTQVGKDITSGRSMVDAKIRVGPNGIEIQFDGYGTREEEDGYGTPVFIEFYDGHLRVVVWDNINEGDPKIIDMEGALCSQRQED